MNLSLISFLFEHTNHRPLDSKIINSGPIIINVIFVILTSSKGVQYAVQEDSHLWTDAPIALIQNGGIRIELDHMKNNGINAALAHKSN